MIVEYQYDYNHGLLVYLDWKGPQHRHGQHLGFLASYCVVDSSLDTRYHTNNVIRRIHATISKDPNKRLRCDENDVSIVLF